MLKVASTEYTRNRGIVDHIVYAVERVNQDKTVAILVIDALEGGLAGPYIVNVDDLLVV